MIRGEYEVRIGDSAPVVIPNQVTIAGMQALLKAMFWGQTMSLKMGLCGRNPGSMLSLAGMQEPAVANGYERQEVAMNQVNWPILSSVNGESYIESREVTFALSGPVSLPVNRLFLTDGIIVVSVSSSFVDGMQLYEDPIVTKYRLFFG